MEDVTRIGDKPPYGKWLLGSDADICGTAFEKTCNFCGTTHNKGYLGEDGAEGDVVVQFVEFGPFTVMECCFGQLVQTLLSWMPEIGAIASAAAEHHGKIAKELLLHIDPFGLPKDTYSSPIIVDRGGSRVHCGFPGFRIVGPWASTARLDIYIGLARMRAEIESTRKSAQELGYSILDAELSDRIFRRFVSMELVSDLQHPFTLDAYQRNEGYVPTGGKILLSRLRS